MGTLLSPVVDPNKLFFKYNMLTLQGTDDVPAPSKTVNVAVVHIQADTYQHLRLLTLSSELVSSEIAKVLRADIHSKEHLLFFYGIPTCEV